MNEPPRVVLLSRRIRDGEADQVWAELYADPTLDYGQTVRLWHAAIDLCEWDFPGVRYGQAV